jgi:hypothetical protein
VMNPACSRPSSLRLRDSKHDTMLLGRPPQGSRGYASHENKEFVRLDRLDAEEAEECCQLEPVEFFYGGQNLRCPVGDDGPGRSAETAESGARHLRFSRH